MYNWRSIEIYLKILSRRLRATYYNCDENLQKESYFNFLTAMVKRR
jgi:hypothetical protein